MPVQSPRDIPELQLAALNEVCRMSRMLEGPTD